MQPSSDVLAFPDETKKKHQPDVEKVIGLFEGRACQEVCDILYLAAEELMLRSYVRKDAPPEQEGAAE